MREEHAGHVDADVGHVEDRPVGAGLLSRRRARGEARETGRCGPSGFRPPRPAAARAPDAQPRWADAAGVVDHDHRGQGSPPRRSVGVREVPALKAAPGLRSSRSCSSEPSRGDRVVSGQLALPRSSWSPGDGEAPRPPRRRRGQGRRGDWLGGHPRPTRRSPIRPEVSLAISDAPRAACRSGTGWPAGTPSAGSCRSHCRSSRTGRSCRRRCARGRAGTARACRGRC